jgi:MoxR-vWA-beta-propeller ternary system domain bpX4
MLSEFLESLFNDGDIVFCAAPQSADKDSADQVLARAFAEYRLKVPGPLIEFDAPTALMAAEFVRWSCWFLVHRDSPATEVSQRLKLPPAPTTASQHLSADLTFRHLPQLHRRARALSPDDVLTTTLTDALRAWPLSGVASDIEEAPTTPLDFGGHAGLELLYAERYVKRPRENWLPNGRIAEYVELVRSS